MVAIESGLVFEIFSRWWWIVKSSAGLIEHQIIENQVKVRQTDNLKCQKTQYFIKKTKKKRVIGLVQSSLTSSSLPLPYTMNVLHVLFRPPYFHQAPGVQGRRRPIADGPLVHPSISTTDQNSNSDPTDGFEGPTIKICWTDSVDRPWLFRCT